MKTLVVKLDDVTHPGNGGIVVADNVSAAEFAEMAGLRGKSRNYNRSLRLWRGNANVGDRVQLTTTTVCAL